MKKPQLKRWAVLKSLELLEGVGDTDAYDLIKKSKKKDDHGDVVLYTFSWFDVLISGGMFTPPVCV